MPDNVKQPSVRFSGYTDAWEQREFGTDLISIQTGTNKLGSSQGKGTPLLKMGNIQRGYFSLDKIEYLSESDQVEPDNIANYGDFFFNTRNTLELVGKGATWIGESGKYAFNSNIARFKFKDLDTIFFNYLYNTASMIEQVHARAMGTTSVAAIYPQSLKSIEYNVPSMDEQRVIGRFLLEIDTLITLHQHKYDKLVNIKKSLLDKMFPRKGAVVPEVRFEGFADAWEQRKVSEIGTFSKGTGYSKSDIRDKGTPLILYGRLYTKYETVIREVDTFTTPKDGSVYSRGGEVLVPASGETAEDISIASVVEKAGVILGGDLNIITPQSGIDSAFLALSISHGEAHRSLSKLAQGKSVVHIHNSDIQTVEVGIPVQAEQESISQFFEKVDRLITLHQRKLEKLRNIKKSFLEKMYI